MTWDNKLFITHLNCYRGYDILKGVQEKKLSAEQLSTPEHKFLHVLMVKMALCNERNMEIVTSS